MLCACQQHDRSACFGKPGLARTAAPGHELFSSLDQRDLGLLGFFRHLGGDRPHQQVHQAGAAVGAHHDFVKPFSRRRSGGSGRPGDRPDMLLVVHAGGVELRASYSQFGQAFLEVVALSSSALTKVRTRCRRPAADAEQVQFEPGGAALQHLLDGACAGGRTVVGKQDLGREAIPLGSQFSGQVDQRSPSAAGLRAASSFCPTRPRKTAPIAAVT